MPNRKKKVIIITTTTIIIIVSTMGFSGTNMCDVSFFFFRLQYLRNFKWDYLTDEIVYRQKIREQKLQVSYPNPSQNQ